jgi:hypothetical protein
MRRALVATVVVLVLGACSSSGSDEANPPTTDASDAESEATTTTEDAPPATIDEDLAALTADDYVGAFTQQLTSSIDGDLTFDEGRAACVAEGWVDVIGVERLQEEGVELEAIEASDFQIDELELGVEVGRELVDVFRGCDADLLDELSSFLAGDDAETQACLVREVDREAFDELLAAGFGGDDADGLEDVFSAAAEACGVVL